MTQSNLKLTKGGLIGGAIGSSALWIVYAIGSFGNDNRLATALLICIAIILIGYLLVWVFRDKYSAHAGIQLSILITFIGYLLALVMMDYLGYLYTIAFNENYPKSSYFYLFIFIFPSLLVYLSNKRQPILNAKNS